MKIWDSVYVCSRMKANDMTLIIKDLSQALHKKTRWHPFVWYSNGPGVGYSCGTQIPDHLASNLFLTI